MSKVWFITGSSKGFGRVWAEAALERGDRVAATARDAGSVADLAERYGEENALPIALDVTDREAAFDAVEQAYEHFGRLDVVVNNAGYGLFGSVEEVSEEQARAQIETNLFGALWVTQAALPILRGQGSGHVVQVSSDGGVYAYPGIALYHASKWGLEGFSQSLAGEVADLGIKVTIVEPGPFGTELRRALGGARRRRSTPTNRCARRTRSSSATRGDLRRPDGHRSGHPRGRGRRRAASAGLLRRHLDRPDPRRLRAPDRDLGQLGRPVQARARQPREERSMTTLITTPFGSESTAAEVVADLDLGGERIVVTGGASGIGIETVRALAGRGAEVTIAARDTAAGERVAADIDGDVRVAPAGAHRPGLGARLRGVAGTARSTCS